MILMHSYSVKGKLYVPITMCNACVSILAVTVTVFTNCWYKHAIFDVSLCILFACGFIDTFHYHHLCFTQKKEGQIKRAWNAAIERKLWSENINSGAYGREASRKLPRTAEEPHQTLRSIMQFILFSLSIWNYLHSDLLSPYPLLVAIVELPAEYLIHTLFSVNMELSTF